MRGFNGVHWGMLMLVVCVGLSAGAPWSLKSYKLCTQLTLGGIWDNASGASYDPRTDTIWVVSRSPLKMLEYDLKGNFKQAKGLPGFWDPEGIAYMWGSRFGVAEESSTIKELDLSGRYWMEEISSARVKLDSERANGGLEGLAFDFNREVFYVVQEKDEKAVLEISHSGQSKVLFYAHHLGIGDLSGIYYSDVEDVLFILSQESKKVVKVTRDGKVLEKIHIEGRRPEGITFSPDGKKMIIIAEPNDFLVYSPDHCEDESV